MENRNIEQLAKEITAQYVAQSQNTEQMNFASEQEKLKKAKASMVMLRNKAILWAVTGLVMTASLVYLGVAWYTRIANTHAVTFEVADYELAVNDNTENEFFVRVYNYSNVAHNQAAPGTDGYIPLKLSARHSEIYIDYSLFMESMMVPTLSEHFRFFVLAKPTVGEDGNVTYEPIVCDLIDEVKDEIPTGVQSVAAEHKKYFLTNFDETSENSQLKALAAEGIQKVYIAPEAEDVTTILEGTIELSREKVVFIYWEWYEDVVDAVSTKGNGFFKKEVAEKDGEGNLTGKTTIQPMTAEDIQDKFYNDILKAIEKDPEAYKDVPLMPEGERPKEPELGEGATKPEEPGEPPTEALPKEEAAPVQPTYPDGDGENPPSDEVIAEYEKKLAEYKAYLALKAAWEEYNNKVTAYAPWKAIEDYDAQVQEVRDYKVKLWEDYCDAWDAADTDAGIYPDKYADAMIFHLTCVGVQSTPLQEEPTFETGGGQEPEEGGGEQQPDEGGGQQPEGSE